MNQPITCRIAQDASEIEAYHRLRRAIFCEEQRLFEGDDRDGWDAAAVPIVAAFDVPDPSTPIIGVVRIYQTSPGVWYGGRLGVDARYRSVGSVGRRLIVKAVTTAHAWGCREFLAVVQPQNVPLFRRMRWSAVEPIEAHGRPHTLMVADLAHYPPSADADVSIYPQLHCHDAA